MASSLLSCSENIWLLGRKTKPAERLGLHALGFVHSLLLILFPDVSNIPPLVWGARGDTDHVLVCRVHQPVVIVSAMFRDDKHMTDMASSYHEYRVRTLRRCSQPKRAELQRSSVINSDWWVVLTLGKIEARKLTSPFLTKFQSRVYSTQKHQWLRLGSHDYSNLPTTFRNIICQMAPLLDSDRKQTFSARRSVCS